MQLRVCRVSGQIESNEPRGTSLRVRMPNQTSTRKLHPGGKWTCTCGCFLSQAGRCGADPASSQAGLVKAPPGCGSPGRGVTGPSGDLGTWDLIGAQQHGTCTPADPGRDRRGPLQSLQFPPVTREQTDGTLPQGPACSVNRNQLSRVAPSTSSIAERGIPRRALPDHRGCRRRKPGRPRARGPRPPGAGR